MFENFNGELSIIELFDGELIVDKIGDKERLHFLIFDTLIHNGLPKIKKK